MAAMGTPTPDCSREPCPDRILDDAGGAFGMGLLGGAAFHFIKGSFNSHWGSRIAGGAQAVRMNAPRTAGCFAVWGGLFSAFDCAMVYARQKEDPWNSIIAGAAAGGFLQMRQGLRASARSALLGGVMLALIEGGQMTINKLTSGQPLIIEEAEKIPMGQLSSPEPASSSGLSSSWFGGLFSRGNKEETPSNEAKPVVLESDTPMPTFAYK